MLGSARKPLNLHAKLSPSVQDQASQPGRRNKRMLCQRPRMCWKKLVALKGSAKIVCAFVSCTVSIPSCSKKAALQAGGTTGDI